jgi:hypothetical protein
MDLPLTVAILYEVLHMEELQFSWETFLVTGGTNPVYQGGQHQMLIVWVVVQLSIQTQVGVGGLLVHHMPQGAIRFSVYVNVQGDRSFDSFSMMNWMLGCMLLRQLRKSFTPSDPSSQIMNVSLTYWNQQTGL